MNHSQSLLRAGLDELLLRLSKTDPFISHEKSMITQFIERHYMLSVMISTAGIGISWADVAAPVQIIAAIVGILIGISTILIKFEEYLEQRRNRIYFSLESERIEERIITELQKDDPNPEVLGEHILDMFDLENRIRNDA